MPSERVQIKLAGRTLSVPKYGDMDQTIGIAKEVNRRLKEIEDASDRIDTQAFALEAAMSFAAEAAELDDVREQDVKDMLLELDKLSKKLQTLIREYKPDAPS